MTKTGEILLQAILRRVTMPGTWLTLGLLITMVLPVLIRRPRPISEAEDQVGEFVIHACQN